MTHQMILYIHIAVLVALAGVVFCAFLISQHNTASLESEISMLNEQIDLIEKQRDYYKEQNELFEKRLEASPLMQCNNY